MNLVCSVRMYGKVFAFCFFAQTSFLRHSLPYFLEYAPRALIYNYVQKEWTLIRGRALNRGGRLLNIFFQPI